MLTPRLPNLTWIAVISLLVSPVILTVAQKQAAVVAGAPLKGVDVKLGRYAGAQFGGNIMTRTTNDKGEFDFGILPAGTYQITLSLSLDERRRHDTAMAAIQNTKRETTVATEPDNCLLIIKGVQGGNKTVGWSFQTSKAFNPLLPATAKLTLSEEKIIVTSNGRDPLSGTCTTIIKSKSNISNN